VLTLVYEEQGRAVCSREPEKIPGLLADRERCFWLDLEEPDEEAFDLLRSLP
jgi:hypothetical protein